MSLLPVSILTCVASLVAAAAHPLEPWLSWAWPQVVAPPSPPCHVAWPQVVAPEDQEGVSAAIMQALTGGWIPAGMRMAVCTGGDDTIEVELDVAPRKDGGRMTGDLP